MKKANHSPLPSPFDWRRLGERAVTAATQATRAAQASRPLSAAERTARILAHRWGNPYCKPGMP